MVVNRNDLLPKLLLDRVLTYSPASIGGGALSAEPFFPPNQDGSFIQITQLNQIKSKYFKKGLKIYNLIC